MSASAPAREGWRPPPLSAPEDVPASAAVGDAPAQDTAAPAAADEESHEDTGRGPHQDHREDTHKDPHQDTREEAYRAGFAQGLEEGRAQAQAQATQMRELLQALAAPFAETDADLMRELLGLTERVCRALLERELLTDSETIARVLSAALDALGESHTAVELTLNPADARLCRELGLLTRGEGEGESEFTLREDAQVQRGGVLLRRGSERVDARIETRLRTIVESLYAQAGLPEPLRTSDDPAESV